MRVQVVAECPDEPEEPNTSSPTLAGRTTARMWVFHIRVTHRARLSLSTRLTMARMVWRRQSPTSPDSPGNGVQSLQEEIDRFRDSPFLWESQLAPLQPVVVLERMRDLGN